MNEGKSEDPEWDRAQAAMIALDLMFVEFLRALLRQEVRTDKLVSLLEDFQRLAAATDYPLSRIVERVVSCLRDRGAEEDEEGDADLSRIIERSLRLYVERLAPDDYASRRRITRRFQLSSEIGRLIAEHDIAQEPARPKRKPAVGRLSPRLPRTKA